MKQQKKYSKPFILSSYNEEGITHINKIIQRILMKRGIIKLWPLKYLSIKVTIR